MNSLLIALLCASASVETAPSTDTPKDYAHSIPIEISGTQGVVRLKLPAEVYQNALSENLNDVRIFDAQGMPQRHAFEEPTVVETEQTFTFPATLFPLYVQRNSADNAPLELDVKIGANGNVLSVHTQEQTDSDVRVLDSLVLDFGPDSQGNESQKLSIHSLVFELPDGVKDYEGQVWLETSTDFREWNSVGVSKLQWLGRGQPYALMANDMSFYPRAFRYARIRWQSGDPIAFARITATAVSQTRIEPALESVWLSPKEGRFPGDLIYDTSPAIAVEQVALRFENENVIFPATLGRYVERPTRDGKSTEWHFQPVHAFTWYQILHNKQIRKPENIQLYQAHARQWVLRSRVETSTVVKPSLGIYWKSRNLVFLAGGKAPYSLRFGRADAVSSAVSIHDVAPGFDAQALSALEWAKTGDWQKGQPPAEAPSVAQEATQTAQRKKFALWAILALAVGILGTLTFRLFRQMNNT